jgi:hypothetical protein
MKPVSTPLKILVWRSVFLQGAAIAGELQPDGQDADSYLPRDTVTGAVLPLGEPGRVVASSIYYTDPVSPESVGHPPRRRSAFSEVNPSIPIHINQSHP